MRYITFSEIRLSVLPWPAVTCQIAGPTVKICLAKSQMLLLKFHHTDCFSVWRYGSLQRLSSYLGCQCDNWFQITFQKPNIQWKYKAVKVKISQIYCSPKNFSLCVFKWWLLIFWLCFKMISSAFSQFIQFNKNDKFWQLLVKPSCCHDSLSEFYFNDTNYIYLGIVVP